MPRRVFSESVVAGTGRIDGLPLALAIMDFRFIGGSMGSVAGEKITRAIEKAMEGRMPLLIISASGGARMQEGLLSLMQMAKTSAALARLAEAGIPYISLLTDPTTGGVTASFASLGDIILAEPGALIGFTGPRVVEQFMHQRLPKGVNTSEFELAHGMIDSVVHRRMLRPTLAKILRLFHNAPAVALQCRMTKKFNQRGAPDRLSRPTPVEEKIDRERKRGIRSWHLISNSSAHLPTSKSAYRLCSARPTV